MLDAARQLSPEELNRDFQTADKSVLGTLVHVFAADRVWLRRLDVVVGAQPEVGACLALFSTEPDEPLTGPPARLLRFAVAGIIPQTSWDEALS